jgi:agmatine deiminase
MWKIPPETARHSRTWLAWPWDGGIWNHIPGTSLRHSQDAFDRLVRAILNYENVSLLARDIDATELERRFKPSSSRRYQVEIVIANYNDIWVRDTLPTFAIDDPGSLVAVNWNFNGWGRRVRPYAAYGDDAQLCGKIAALTGAALVDSGITAEGGAFAFDEESLTIATRSVIIDRFRNPGCAKAELEEAIVKATGRQRTGARTHKSSSVGVAQCPLRSDSDRSAACREMTWANRGNWPVNFIANILDQGISLACAEMPMQQSFSSISSQHLPRRSAA